MDPRRTTTTLLLALLALGTTGFGRCGSEWKVLWHDEFDGPAGQSPDPANWSADIGTDWGNQQLEFDTDRPENVSLDGAGNLVITARRETYQGKPYTSARLLTKEKRVQRYGRIEARMKLPIGQGMWPAFWLLGANIDQVGWPTCGEIDVMENKGQEPQTINATLHGPGYSAADGSPEKSLVARPPSDFHVFAVEWDAGMIAFELDGEVYKVIKKGDQPAGTAWVFDQPFFILLNLAVGGGYVGAPDASTVFPQRLVVDYVRVYQRDP
jgi:beta-glucanase (GH16 family)